MTNFRFNPKSLNEFVNFSSALKEYFKKVNSRYMLSIICATFKLLLDLFK